MSTEERLERMEREPARAKGRSRPLIVIGLVLLGAAGLPIILTMALMRNKPVGVAPLGFLMLIAAGAGLLCFVLGCVPFRARLMTLGILLLGITAAIAAWATGERIFGAYSSAEKAALWGFVIAVIGLSGLVCGCLGFARFVRRRKGT